MATTPNGIMTLPENDQMGAPQLSLNESYDAMRQGLKNARPDAAADVDSTMAEILPQLDGMPDDVIDKLLQTVQYLKDNPDQYAEVVAKLISMGVVKEGDFPPEYDPEFLATMGIVLLEAQRSRSQAPLQPTGFANGGLADAARIMAAQGRGRDSMLAHITPSEASLLRSRGGMGTRNPSTGLPEYGFFDDLWSGFKGAVTGVFDAVKGILKSPIGRVVGTIALGAFLGPGAFGITGLGLGAAAAPLASGIISGLSGGSAMDMLTSAATSYLGSAASPLSQYVGNLTSGLGLGSMASQALTSGLVGTGVGLLTGKSLEDSVSSGLQGAVMNTAMDYMNANKAPVPDADRAPVSNAVIKPVPGSAGEIGSNLKTGDVSGYGGFKPLPNQSGYGGFKPPSYALDAPSGGIGELGLRLPSGTNSSGLGLPPPAPSPVAQNASASASAGDYKYPDLMDSAGKMFQSGRFMEGAKDTFFPSGPTSAQVTGSTEFKNLRAAGFSAEEAFKRASNTLSPDMLRQYGPLAAAGLGIMGLTGGFDQKPLPQSALNASLTGGAGSYQDLMAKNPRKYYAQHLPGVLYDDNGAIIGYQGPGGSRQLYNQGGAVGYAEGGEAGENTATSLQEVTELYRKYAKREPDASGLAYWMKDFGDSVSPEEEKSFEESLYINEPSMNPNGPVYGGPAVYPPYTGGGVVDMQVFVYGPDGTSYSSPAAARAAGVTNYTIERPANTGTTGTGTTPTWDGPAWGPGSMVYQNIAAAIAAGVPRDKLFKTALEAYRGKANVVTPVIPPVVPVVPPVIPPVIPVVPPVVVDGGGGGGDSGGNDGGGSGGGGGGQGQTGWGTVANLAGEANRAGLSTIAGWLSSAIPTGAEYNKTNMETGLPEKGNLTQADKDAMSGKSDKGSSVSMDYAGGIPDPGTGLQGQGYFDGQTGLYGDAAAGTGMSTNSAVGTSGGVATGTSGGSPADAGGPAGGPAGGEGGSQPGGSGDAPGQDHGGEAKGGYIGGYAQGGMMGLNEVKRLYEGGDAAGYGYGEGEGAAQSAGMGGYGSMGELDGGGAELISQSNIANMSNRKSSLPAYDSIMLAQSLEPMRPAMVGHTSGILTGIQDANNNVSRNVYGYQDVQQAKDAYESLVAEQGMRNNIDNNTFSENRGNDRAKGGMMGSNGIASLLQGGYPRKTGEIAGPGTGTSDDIPAMLSDGEFVMTAKAVRGAGKGSRRDGAKRMYALMHQLERNAARG